MFIDLTAYLSFPKIVLFGNFITVTDLLKKLEKISIKKNQVH